MTETKTKKASEKLADLKAKYQSSLNNTIQRKSALEAEVAQCMAGIEQYRGAIHALEQAEGFATQDEAPSTSPALKLAPKEEAPAPEATPSTEATDGQA